MSTATALLASGGQLRYLWHRYVIESAIARSGFGATFRARRVRDGQPVLVKQILEKSELADFKEELVRGVKREARFLRRSRHPAFPRGYHAFKRDGCFYLVMEYINGKPLSQAIDDYREVAGTVPDGLLLSLGLAIADALRVVHRKGYVHRDVKPQNVMVDGVNGRIRIIDFGTLYQRTDTDVLVFESEGYTAPELAEGQGRPTPAGDVYGLGAILFEAATGRCPEPGESLDDPERDGRLREFVDRCLLRDPEERLPHGGAALAALSRIAKPPRFGGKADPIVPLELSVIPKSNVPAGCAFCVRCGHHDPESPSGLCASCGVPLKAGRLTWEGTEGKTVGCHLYATQTHLGSDADADVPLGHLPGGDDLSPRHARIFREETALFLEPWRSNETDTKLDGRRVRGAVELRDGDVLELGTIKLTFRMVDAC